MASDDTGPSESGENDTAHAIALSDYSLVDSDTDDEIRSTTPLKEVIKEISNIITCLYRLSIAIQSPASHERLERMEKIDMSFFEPFDIEHVGNKYYHLGDEFKYLIERLGKANTKRRQFLKYHNDHHERIIGHRTAIMAGSTEESQFELGEDDFYGSEVPTDMRTTVTTVYEGDIDLVEVEALNLDSRSEAGFSMTSYATSTSSSESGALRVPPPPHGFEDGPFQCPFCFVIVEPKPELPGSESSLLKKDV
jgi:hypothetical protein